MGKGAYNIALACGMKIYFAKDDEQTLDEVIAKFESNQLPLITEESLSFYHNLAVAVMTIITMNIMITP
jgi:predicted Fe-Mo cluster-binding NifX family protein